MSARLEAECMFVVRELGANSSICDRCNTELSEFADKCTADLADACPGFMAIKAAKEKFNREWASKAISK